MLAKLIDKAGNFQPYAMYSQRENALQDKQPAINTLYFRNATMRNANVTMLRVKQSTRERLRQLGKKGDTWDAILLQLIENKNAGAREGAQLDTCGSPALDKTEVPDSE